MRKYCTERSGSYAFPWRLALAQRFAWRVLRVQPETEEGLEGEMSACRARALEQPGFQPLRGLNAYGAVCLSPKSQDLAGAEARPARTIWPSAQHWTNVIAFVLAAYLCLIYADVLMQPRYDITRIIPDSVRGFAQGMALNDAGHVVGEYCPLPPGRCKPFLARDGRIELIDLEIQDSKSARAAFITNQGLVAGTYQTDGRFSGSRILASFLYKDGRLNPVKPAWPLDGFMIVGLNDRGDAIGRDYNGEQDYIYLGGELRMIRQGDLAFRSASALNQAGQVAGGRTQRVPRSDGIGEVSQPYVMSKTITQRLNPGRPDVGIQSVAALNNHGHVVGQAWSHAPGQPEGFQAFVAKEGRIEILDVHRDESNATDINDQGMIVGFRHDRPLLIPVAGASIRRSAFLWIDGKTYDLDKIAGKTINRELPLRINQRGQILVNVDRQAYLLTPETR